MNLSVLSPEVQHFIATRWDADPVSILLQKPFFENISQKELVQQLESKKKCRHKLPTWFHTPDIYYPKKLHIEQTSSELTALYKAQLIAGETIVDLTGGWGVDACFFAQKMAAVFHCEINPELSVIARHNFNVLGRKNIHPITTDGLEYLRKNPKTFDWVYADPSRRSTTSKKVFRLSESDPDIPAHLPLIFKKTNNILLKAAPLLDISQGIRELQFVKEVHVVAIHNQVKELLFILQYGYTEAVTIKTITIGREQPTGFSFQLHEEQSTIPEYGPIHQYLYEPNAALLKSGGFKCVGKAFGVAKLHPHSHLYTTDVLVDFPGRRFKILECKLYSKRVMEKLGIKKANVTTRNFPYTVAGLRKKHSIKDGGEHYLFFTTDYENRLRVIHCARI